MEARGSHAVTIAAALLVAAGIAVGGWFVGKGAARFKSETRTVTVKGLVEREVKADFAEWTLTLRRASDSLADAHARISQDRDAAIDFLHRHGFTDAEIERQPTRTLDKLAREYGPGERNDKLRYIVTTSVVARTPQVDRMRAATGATEELLKSGVVLDSANENGRANPRYVVSKFNDLRPALLQDATRNARQIAQQFAADSGATVGAIRSANQGNIQIFGTDGNDESAPYAPTSTLVKRIRVVSTFEFELR